MAEDPVTVLIADDHPITRSGLQYALRAYPRYTVVACASDGAEALDLIIEHQPDVVLLDLMLPKISGLLVIEAIAKQGLATRMMLISGQASGAHFQHALDAGALGVASKADSPEELIEGIETMLKGETFHSQAAAKLMLPPRHSEVGTHAGTTLTPREQEILALVAQGLSNKAISQQLGIAHNTVRKHRENIRQKTGVSSSVEMTHLAAQMGLTKLL